MPEKKPSTTAARAGGFHDPLSGGVVPPIQPSTTFVRDTEYRLVNPENSYGRDDNDQVRLAERILSELEGAGETLLFSSGMAAVAALTNTLKRGETLLVQKGIYWGTTDWTRKFCEKREIQLLEFDAWDPDNVAQVIPGSKPSMILVETPSNPWIRSVDIAFLAELAKPFGGVLAVDSTVATPLLTRPLELGADIVVHSATKAINGHSDVLAGVLSCKESNSSLWHDIAETRHGAGAILSAYSAWLLIRGIRTLPLRIEKMSANAMAIARFLADHPAVEDVWYPGLEDNPDHAIAKRQMHGGFGYLLSFLVKGGLKSALQFMKQLEGIHRATSLGGTESLVEHRHTVEGELTGVPENLVRMSVGIEDPGDLMGELDNALKTLR